MTRIAGLLALLCLSGCGDAPELGDDSRTWTVVGLNGATFAASAAVTFMEDGTMRGAAPCNRISGAWSGRLDALKIGPVVSTRMACPELPAEQAFLSALSAATRAEITDDGLRLSGGGHVLELSAES